MNVTRLLLLVSIASILGACGSGNNVVVNHSCYAPDFTDQVAQQLLTNWGNGLQTYNLTNNPDIYVSAGYFTMSFYTPDAILQPTVSPIQREGTQQIYNYFTGFLKSNPVMSFDPKLNDAASLGCGFGSYVGNYTFTLNPNTAQESTVAGRFTFIYEYMPTVFTESFSVESEGGVGETFIQTNQPGWYIMQQQSSILPLAKD